MLLRPVVVRPSPSWCRLCTTWFSSSSAPSTPSKLGKYQVNSELGFTKHRNNKYILPSQFSMVFFFYLWIHKFNSPISLVKYFCFVVSLFCISGPRAEYELYLQYVYLWRENVRFCSKFIILVLTFMWAEWGFVQKSFRPYIFAHFERFP